MRAVPVVPVREFRQVHLPAPLNTASTRERLRETALSAGVDAFEIRGQRIFAKGVVGVVDTGAIVVEILPKVRSDSSTGEDLAFLSNLLQYAGGGRLPALTQAAIAAQSGGLLEILLAWAARRVADGIREGLPRRYSERVEVSTSVRGRVDLRRLAGQHPGRTLDLTVRHAPLGQDNHVSRAIKWLVRDIGRRTRSIGTRTLCLRLLDEMGAVPDRELSLEALDCAALNPFEERWAPLLALARAFMAQHLLNPARGGGVSAVAVLLTLHDLFEGAIRRVLAEGLPSLGHDLLSGRAGHLLLGSGRPSIVGLRPDFRIGRVGQRGTVVVGDAKWKRILDKGGSPRIVEDDAYQVTAYAAALGADRAFVVAPVSVTPVLRQEDYRIAGIDVPFQFVGVHVPTLVEGGPAGRELRRMLCEAVAAVPVEASDGQTAPAIALPVAL